ncbi:9923_t:CDS:2 [Paraglomus brasilianum]|uniref:9923_t:CDS:1 n=1 Tax=Paraglomus brasilianum TaxID=144538 RepID=A0A9N8VWB3_9GLOM|nr:9923_t:CDS:2 [Paraglomus brasilianum]
MGRRKSNYLSLKKSKQEFETGSKKYDNREISQIKAIRTYEDLEGDAEDQFMKERDKVLLEDDLYADGKSTNSLYGMQLRINRMSEEDFIDDIWTTDVSDQSQVVLTFADLVQNSSNSTTSLAEEQMSTSMDTHSSIGTPKHNDAELLPETAKRAINYQIMKNKGLTPTRKKEQRNPRVKHRKKFERAKKRIKSIKRVVAPKVGPYAGELTGIKTNLSRSIKFK